MRTIYSPGVVASADDSIKGFNIARAVARIPLAETTNRLFMAAYLNTDFVQRYFTNELRVVSQPTLNIKQLGAVVAQHGRWADGTFNEHDIRDNLAPALRAYARFVQANFAEPDASHQPTIIHQDLPEYLHRVVNAPCTTAQFNGSLKGIGVPNLHLKEIRRALIPLPPLDQQKRIAEILDRAESLRAQRRAALAQLDSLTQSIFLDMFGDPAINSKKFPQKPLASLVRSDDTINYGVVQPGDDLEKGIPLIRVGDLIDGKVAHSHLKRIDPSIEAAYKRSRLRGDEILVSCVGSIARLQQRRCTQASAFGRCRRQSGCGWRNDVL